jgi:hypothetical protein
MGSTNARLGYDIRAPESAVSPFAIAGRDPYAFAATLGQFEHSIDQFKEDDSQLYEVFYRVSAAIRVRVSQLPKGSIERSALETKLTETLEDIMKRTDYSQESAKRLTFAVA